MPARSSETLSVLSLKERAENKGLPLFPGSLPLSTIVESTIDDSVLTVAATEWMLAGKNLVDLLHAYTDTYPNADTAVFATGPVPPSQTLQRLWQWPRYAGEPQSRSRP